MVVTHLLEHLTCCGTALSTRDRSGLAIATSPYHESALALSFYPHEQAKLANLFYKICFLPQLKLEAHLRRHTKQASSLDSMIARNMTTLQLKEWIACIG